MQYFFARHPEMLRKVTGVDNPWTLWTPTEA